MTRVIGLLGALAVVLAVRLAPAGDSTAGASAVMALGFVLIVSFLVGDAVTLAGLPAITGYLLAGMVFGPYVFGWVDPVFSVLSRESVSALRLLDAVALGLIALTAGGELRISAVKRHWHSISGVLGGQVILVFAGMVGGVLIARDTFPALNAYSKETALAAALLFATVALANSPAVVLAIIQECRSRGPVTDVVLAVTVVKDVVVIALFIVVLSVAALLTGANGGFQGGVLLGLGWEVGGSLGAGLLLGWLVAMYLKHVAHEAPLLILAVAFVAVTLLPAWHLSGILACIVAGFYIENFSEHGDDLIRAIERHALPVYVVFFTMAGAGLDLEALATTWPLALYLAGLRLGLTAAGTALGAAWAGSPVNVVKHGWSGFVAQAGVTLGFAVLIQQRLPGIGEDIMTVILAMVAINQLLGPVLFRLGLRLAREIGAEEISPGLAGKETQNR